MSVPDREQLACDLADVIAKANRRPPGDDQHWQKWVREAKRCLLALNELGYSVTPAESPAEAPEQRSPGPEGSEATHTAERPIAEIIGWTSEGTWFVDEPDGTAEVPVWIKPNGLRSVVEPSVDDMARWVQQQGYSLLFDQVKGGYIVMLYADADGPFGDCEAVDCWPDPGTDDPPIPTMHEGAEIAVRAVAVETEETPT